METSEIDGIFMEVYICIYVRAEEKERKLDAEYRRVSESEALIDSEAVTIIIIKLWSVVYMLAQVLITSLGSETSLIMKINLGLGLVSAVSPPRQPCLHTHVVLHLLNSPEEGPQRNQGAEKKHIGE